MRIVLGLAAAAAALIAVPTSPAAVTPVAGAGTTLPRPTACATGSAARRSTSSTRSRPTVRIASAGSRRAWRRTSPRSTPGGAVRTRRARHGSTSSTFRAASRQGLLDLSRCASASPPRATPPLGGRYGRIAGQLGGVPFGLASAEKKYLVFYDGVVPADDVCGTGHRLRTARPLVCGRVPPLELRPHGRGGRGAAFVGAHELYPRTGSSRRPRPPLVRGRTRLRLAGRPDERELRRRAARGRAPGRGQGRLLRASGPLVRHPGLRLAAARGRAVLAHAAADRGRDDRERARRAGVPVDLHDRVERRHVRSARGEAAAGYAFGGWTGPCAAEREPSCLVTVGQNLEVGAIFRPLRRLAILLTGRGRVTAAGVRAPGRALHGSPREHA